MADSWNKLNDDLKKKLKDYKYTFGQACKLVGCGEKTLRRYMDAEYIQPIKISDEWLFTEDIIQKCKFIYKMRYNKLCNIATAIALYDYMEKHYVKASYDEIFNKKE